MTNKMKKLKIFSALALVSAFGLTACDDIVAKPTDYDATIATIDGYDEEIYNNLMSIIYDAIHDDSVGSEVLDRVLYQYSMSIFGAYNDQIDTRNKDEVTLREAYDSAISDDKSVAKQFIVDHKAYWSVDSDGNRVNDDGEEEAITVDNVTDLEISRLTARYEDIEKRIAQKMYDSISGGSYSERSLFYEEKLLMSLANGMASVANPLESGVSLSDGILLDPNTEDYEVWDITVDTDGDGVADDSILHRENYQSDYVGQDVAADSAEYTYIEDTIVPEIYTEMLVEQYLMDSSYSTLGRSYARKVNIIAITVNEDYPLETRYLIDAFVDKYISGERAAPSTNGEPAASVYESDNKVDLDTFKILSNAVKGVGMDEEENAESKALLDEAGYPTSTIGEETVYLGTDYGDMMEDYEKINNNPYLTDDDIESDFTNSGAYTKEVGKTIKEREVQLVDYTTTGWYIKNGGLSDLPDSIRNRLFNVGVANRIAENEKAESRVSQDRWQLVDGEWVYSDESDTSSYVALINGSYYLLNDDTTGVTSANDMVFYDTDSSTYYIIEIEAAASSSKLSKVNENRYTEALVNDDDTAEERLEHQELAETYINEICTEVAADDTYSTLSTKYWLEKAGINYHDDDVYDYFYENYPELFEDDD